MKSELTQAELKRLLHYDPDTGIFVWLVSSRNRADTGNAAGTVFTCRRGKSYRRIGIKGKQYYAHHLAFLWMNGEFPSEEVDHISGDGLDNTWTNIREVSHQGNSRNQRLHKTNTSGHVGVSWNVNAKKWQAFITVSGRRKHLGHFADKNKAITARQNFGIEFGFHENHGQRRAL